MDKLIKSGIIHVNGVNIQYNITDNYFNSAENMVAHCEFSSLSKARENVLSTTGYKSHFFGICQENFSRQIDTNHKEIIEHLVKHYAIENGLKIRSFSFGYAEEMRVEKAIQQSLFLNLKPNHYE